MKLYVFLGVCAHSPCATALSWSIVHMDSFTKCCGTTGKSHPACSTHGHLRSPVVWTTYTPTKSSTEISNHPSKFNRAASPPHPYDCLCIGYVLALVKTLKGYIYIYIHGFGSSRATYKCCYFSENSYCSHPSHFCVGVFISFSGAVGSRGTFCVGLESLPIIIVAGVIPEAGFPWH